MKSKGRTFTREDLESFLSTAPDQLKDWAQQQLAQFDEAHQETPEDGDDDEDGPEQDRLTQVDGHGTPPHRGGQPTQTRQPAVRRRPTGVEGQHGEPAAASGQAEDHDQRGVDLPGLGTCERDENIVERSERPQSQAAEPNGRQQAAVALGVGDEVGVGQAGPKEGGRKNHRGEGHPDSEREPLAHVGHEPGQRGQH